MNKKELKREISSKYMLEKAKSKGSFVYVEISCMHEDKEYRAFDFAKWSTEDMDTVSRATRLYQSMLEKDCGCSYCRSSQKHLAHLIEKYNWSEARGIDIAIGRAMADIVGQIMGDQSANKVLGEKSKSGFSAPEVNEMKKELV
jgi:hypothetical protein